MSIALLRYKLFAIDKVINKSMVYGLVMGLSTCVYVGASLGFSLLFTGDMPTSVFSLPSIASTFLVVTLFVPLRGGVQGVVDKVFFKSKVQSEELIKEVSLGLVTHTTYANIKSLMINAVVDKLQIQGAWLYLMDMESHELVNVERIQEEDPEDEVSNQLLNYLLSQSQGLEVQFIDEDEGETARKLYGQGMRILIPLRHREELVGVYAVSDKKSGLSYTPSDVEVLKAIASQLSVVTRNAQMFGRVEKTVEELRRIIGTISEGVMVLDRSGKITQINEQTLSLLGLSRGKTLLMPYEQVVTFSEDEEGKQPSTAIQLALEEGVGHKGNYWVHTDQHRLPVALTVSILHTTEHTHQGVVLTFYDRTEELSILSAKDEFIATASHELRTPVTVVRGYVKKLLGEYPEDQNLKVIDEKAEQLMRKLGQLIEISEVQSGARKVEAKEIDLSLLLTPLVKPLEQRARGAQLEFGAHIPSSIKVQADAKALTRVVELLLDNAFRYTSQGKVEMGVEQVGEAVMLTIRDTGIGISRQIQKALFTPFTQEGGALYRDEAKGGLGLGLYLAKRYVELMGGEISYEEREGGGSVFRVRLAV
jgi:PAS domain S-box-containing protein